MGRDNMLFGDGYYSGNPDDIIEEHGRDFERELESLLLEQDPNIKLRIEKAAKDYKKKIQTSLRNETALTLSDSSGNASIKVKVVPGLPVVVRKRLEGGPNPTLPRIFVDKTSLLSPELREAVRFALLEARSGDRRHPQKFVDTLREVRDRLRLGK